MMTAIRAEFRKLFSVRSTYIVTSLVIIAIAFIGFYVEGWRLTPHELADPGQLSSAVLGGLNFTVFGALVAILSVTHEYRYNTIMYTLTISNSRSKVLLAKILTLSTYALCLTALIVILAPSMTYLGVAAHGHSFVPQTLHIWNLAWRSLFNGWAYAMAGLLLAVLIRIQVGAVAALFLIPGLVEGILGQIFKSAAPYMPFTSLSEVINSSNVPTGVKQLPPSKAALIFTAYLIGGWLVAWFLFLRRDAN